MGAEPFRLGKTAPSTRKRRTGLWLLAIPLGLFILLSIRPVMRLRVEPPAEFLDMQFGRWDAKRRAVEERVARAYWERAVQLVQWKHSFGTPLPDNPPPEFNIEGKGFQRGSVEAGPVTRARYWKKLRDAWVLPQAWDKSYEWNTDWIHATLGSLQETARRLVEDILRSFRT